MLNLLIFAFLSTIYFNISCKISYISQLPIVDGALEQIWFTSSQITGFSQYYPKEGDSASEKTIAYIMQDTDNLYIAFKCYDVKPNKIHAKIVPRDHWDGDHVWVILDTFRNQTTAYEWGTRKF